MEILDDLISNIVESHLATIKKMGLKEYIQNYVSKIDMDTLFLSQIKKRLSYSRNINISPKLGRVNLQYRNNKIQINTSGIVSWFISEVTITDKQIIAAINDVIDQFQKKYIDDLSYLLSKFYEILKSLSKTEIYKPKTAEEKTLYDVLMLILLNKYKKEEKVPIWLKSAIDKLDKDDVIKHLLISLVEQLSSIAENISENLYLNLKLAFDSKVLRVTLNKMTNNGQLSGFFNMFGIDINEELNDFVDEYMTPSIVSGIGEIMLEVVNSMLYEEISQNQEDTKQKLKPYQVTMTLGEDVYTQRNIRWYTEISEDSSCLQYSSSKEFLNFTTIEAIGETVLKPSTVFSLGLISIHKTKSEKKYSAVIDNLIPGNTYWYRVGNINTGCFSDVFSFSVPRSNDGFTFLSLADSQGMVKSDYDSFTKVFEESTNKIKNVDFVVHLGDFVDDGNNEDYWHYLLDRSVWGSNVVLPMAGNHEAKVKRAILDSGGENSVLYHFNVSKYPKQDTSTGVYYSFVYKNATFIILNTNDLDDEGKLSKSQYDWALDVARKAKTKWKIVFSHKSPYSNGPHYNDNDVREVSEQIKKICRDGKIDLLLGGHDHVYVRTPILFDNIKANYETKILKYNDLYYHTAVNPNGTLFIIPGTSGVKNYKQDKSAVIPTEFMDDPELPIYSIVKVEEDRLYFTAYIYDEKSRQSQVFDTYAIEKTQNSIMTKTKECLCESNEKLGKAVTVSCRSEFLNAVRDPKVGTIITDGSDIKFERLLGYGTDIVVNRDLVIKGSSRLIHVCFHVKNKATLVIDDMIFIDNSRRYNSLFPAINVAKVFDDSKFVISGKAVMRTDYGIGKNAYCVNLLGKNSKAIFNSRSEQWGEKGIVFSNVPSSEILITNGKYMSKGKNYTIKSNGKINVENSIIKSIYILEKGVLNLKSGTIGKYERDTKFIPLKILGSCYITGGTVTKKKNKSILLDGLGELHISPIHNGAVQISGQIPYIDLLEKRKKNKKIIESKVLGLNVIANSLDYLYSADRNIESPFEQVDIREIRSQGLNKFYISDKDKAIFAKIKVNRMINGIVCKGNCSVYLLSKVNNQYKQE